MYISDSLSVSCRSPDTAVRRAQSALRRACESLKIQYGFYGIARSENKARNKGVGGVGPGPNSRTEQNTPTASENTRGKICFLRALQYRVALAAEVLYARQLRAPPCSSAKYGARFQLHRCLIPPSSSSRATTESGGSARAAGQPVRNGTTRSAESR